MYLIFLELSAASALVRESLGMSGSEYDELEAGEYTCVCESECEWV